MRCGNLLLHLKVRENFDKRKLYDLPTVIQVVIRQLNRVFCVMCNEDNICFHFISPRNNLLAHWQGSAFFRGVLIYWVA